VIGWARKDSPGIEEKLNPQEHNRYSADRKIEITYCDSEDRIALQNKPNVSIADLEDYCMGNLSIIDDSEAWYCRFRDGWKSMPGANAKMPFTSASSSFSISIVGPKVEDKKTKKMIDAEPKHVQASVILKNLMSKPIWNQNVYSTEAYLPYFKELPAGRVWNRFKGWMHSWTDISVGDGDPDIAAILELLNDLSGRSPAVLTYFKGWLSNYVQNPQSKMPLIMLYSSIQGVGKGILETFLTEYVFGEDQCMGTTNPQIILGHFNAAACDHQLYILQELKAEGLNDIDTLKELVTGKRITRQRKCKEADKSKNYAKYMMATNHPDVMRIEPSDRRCLLIECNCEHAGDHDYYSRLTDLIFKKSVGAKFLNYLAQYDLTDFRPQAIPSTQLKEDAKIRSMPTPLLHIKEVCEGKRQWTIYGKEPQWVCVKELFADYQSWCGEEGIYAKTKAMTYKQTMRALGFPEKPKQIMIERERAYCYCFDYAALDIAFQKYLRRNTTILEIPIDIPDQPDLGDE
jgi:hypothetical protein